MKHPPTKEQQAILDAKKDTEVLMIGARAGCAKTDTGVRITEAYPDRSFRFIVFGAKNAQEFASKLPKNAIGTTKHSFCNSFIKKRYNLDKTGFKMFKIIVKDEDYNFKNPNLSKEEVFATRENLNAMKDLVGLLKNSYISPTPEDVAYIMSHFGITLSLDFEQVCNDAVRFLGESDNLVTELDYNDMVRLPIISGSIRFNFDELFLDEAQDNNPISNELLRQAKKAGCGVTVVGDECQPTGTKILQLKKIGTAAKYTTTNEINIEDIKVGDKIMSYDLAGCSYVSERTVKGVTKRPYNGELIVVSSELGHVSKYTPNHHCLANFEHLRNKYIIYMMRQGNKYRIGKSKFSYDAKGRTSQTGVVSRARAEKADCLWILNYFDTECEAFLMEQSYSGKFGIPQLRFSSEDQTTQERLDLAWEFIGDNTDRAIKCLEHFGRKLDYPLWDKVKHKEYFSLKRPVIVYACNLMTGVKMAPFRKESNHLYKHHWVDLNVSKENYNGFVYSLTVEGERLYIADKLVTHNCQAIMGFTGADCDSMNKIIQMINPLVLPLTTNFRCGKNIIREAQRLVPDINYWENSPDGVVSHRNNDEFMKLFKDGDCALSRFNRVIIPMCFKLIKDGRKATVQGRDFGTMLKTMVTGFKATSIEEFYDSIDRWKERQLEKTKSDSQADAVEDKFECLKYFADNSDTVEQIADTIDKIFSDKETEGLKLSTAHRSKGLEWDRVFILDSNNFMQTHPNDKEWNKQQLKNLMYVAQTRGKQSLTYVSSQKV